MAGDVAGQVGEEQRGLANLVGLTRRPRPTRLRKTSMVPRSRSDAAFGSRLARSRYRGCPGPIHRHRPHQIDEPALAAP